MQRSLGTKLRALLARVGLGSPEEEQASSPWEIVPPPERVIAIGDLHGDVRALGAILIACGLLDGDAAWSGGRTHLVLVGDLIGGDRRSRLLLNSVLRLEREAARAGGRVHALLGNHDVLPVVGHFDKLTRAERAEYTRMPVPDAAGAALSDAFRGDSVYAKWLRARHTMLKIGDTLFVHAGLDDWALDSDPAQINADVRDWIAHWQGVGPRPKKGSRWTVTGGRKRDGGPLWTRSFKVRGGKRPRGSPSRKTLRAILERYGVARVVVGHSPTAGREVLLAHPRYGEGVVLIDTRISDPRRGRMSAVAIERGTVTPIYAEDRDAGAPLEEREARALDRGETSDRPAPSVTDRALSWLRGLFGGKR